MLLKERRMVTLLHGVAHARKSGGRTRLWAYGMNTLAEFFEVSEAFVRYAIREKRFDPTSLTSIMQYKQKVLAHWAKRASKMPNPETPASS